jgi:hypothetical protein
LNLITLILIDLSMCRVYALYTLLVLRKWDWFQSCPLIKPHSLLEIFKNFNIFSINLSETQTFIFYIIPFCTLILILCGLYHFIVFSIYLEYPFASYESLSFRWSLNIWIPALEYIASHTSSSSRPIECALELKPVYHLCY